MTPIVRKNKELASDDAPVAPDSHYPPFDPPANLEPTMGLPGSVRKNAKEHAPSFDAAQGPVLSARSTAEPSLERWRGRLRPVPAKARLQERVVERRLERPRTVQEAAEELGLSVYTVRAWVASRRIEHLRLGRAIRIPAAEIRRVIEQSTVPAVQEE